MIRKDDTKRSGKLSNKILNMKFMQNEVLIHKEKLIEESDNWNLIDETSNFNNKLDSNKLQKDHSKLRSKQVLKNIYDGARRNFLKKKTKQEPLEIEEQKPLNYHKGRKNLRNKN